MSVEVLKAKPQVIPELFEGLKIFFSDSQWRRELLNLTFTSPGMTLKVSVSNIFEKNSLQIFKLFQRHLRRQLSSTGMKA